MTLREKLCQPFDGLPTETIDKLEKIVDAEMISFAEFLEIYQGGTSNKQLLKIYKIKST